MNDIRKFFTIFPLFLIAVVFFAGCSVPIGGLLVDNSKYIRAMPIKTLYPKGVTFKVTDVAVVVYVFEGREQRFNINDIINDVEIKIIEPDITVVVDSEYGKPLVKAGTFTVEVSYLGLKDSYFIQVVAPEDVPGWHGGGTGINVKWPV